MNRFFGLIAPVFCCFLQVQGQRLQYKLENSLTVGRIEKLYSNGSLLYSHMPDRSTVRIDSIDYFGNVAIIYEKVFQDTFGYDGYDFNPEKGLYISKNINIPDTCEWCSKKLLEYWPSVDSLAWSIEVTRGYAGHNGYKPFYTEHGIQMQGDYWDDGMCFSEYGSYLISHSGIEVTNHRYIGCDGYFETVEGIDLLSIYRWCGCGEPLPKPGIIFEVSDSLKLDTLFYGEYEDPVRGVFVMPFVRILNDSHYWGVTHEEHSNGERGAFLIDSSGRWNSIENLLGESVSHDYRVISVKKFENDFFILSEKKSFDSGFDYKYDVFLSRLDISTGQIEKYQIKERTADSWRALEIREVWELDNSELGVFISRWRYLYPGVESAQHLFIFNNWSLWIKHSVDSLNFEIYPNPTSGQFTFQSDEPGHYSILNLSGQLIQEGVFEVGKNRVDLGKRIPKGIYFIRLETRAGETVTQKLVLSN